MKSKKEIKKIMQFICEAGMLKNVKRSGWSVLGIKHQESVAEHSFRCAVIGYILAEMEGVSVFKVLTMALLNDMQEARITDLHKMSQRYINIDKTEGIVFNEQVANLPMSLRRRLESLREEYRRQKTKESILARDADILECLIQAKEYYEQGFKKAIEFTKKAPRFLKSPSAKKLWKFAKENNITNWWLALSDFKR